MRSLSAENQRRALATSALLTYWGTFNSVQDKGYAMINGCTRHFNGSVGPPCVPFLQTFKYLSRFIKGLIALRVGTVNFFPRAE